MKKRYFEIEGTQEESPNGAEADLKTKKFKKKYSSKSDCDRNHSQDSSSEEQGGSANIHQKVHDLSNFDPGHFQSSKQNLNRSLKFRTGSSFQRKQFRERDDPYPGDAPIPEEWITKYKRGDPAEVTGIRTKYHAKKLKEKEKKFEMAVKQAARTEMLLTEEQGYIEPDEGEQTLDYTQHKIAEAVDISSAEKFFELKLDKFGPYRMNYTRNGRFLLLGGARGHVAAIDWQTKKLMCEMNVMETCADVKWLHIETMFAVAQRLWTYIYDNQGIELHCLKALDSVLRLEFLPYHFLLVSGNTKGYLQWLDVSVGKKVAGFMTGLGRLDVMCQNPANAIIHLGHPGGTVSLWSPNIKEPVVKMLCHGSGTRSIAITKDGQYMATSGLDRTLKIWDLRMFKLLHGYRITMGAGQLSFSQRGLLTAGLGNVIEIYKDTCSQTEMSTYLRHRLRHSVAGLEFCPYEDVLGVGHSAGFSSLLVPGAGEPNFDALEANPYQSKRQRQHAEVKMLLEKVQPDMINLDTSALGKVDRKTLEEKLEEKKKLLYVKPPKIDFEPKYKKKGRSKAGKIEQRKSAVRDQHKREFIKELRQIKQQLGTEETQMKSPIKYDALNRFSKKSS